jgi:hypothetical protein
MGSGPEERTAYRCSFCGIIFDSVKHRYPFLNKLLLWNLSHPGPDTKLTVSTKPFYPAVSGAGSDLGLPDPDS